MDFLFPKLLLVTKAISTSLSRRSPRGHKTANWKITLRELKVEFLKRHKRSKYLESMFKNFFALKLSFSRGLVVALETFSQTGDYASELTLFSLRHTKSKHFLSLKFDSYRWRFGKMNSPNISLALRKNIESLSRIPISKHLWRISSHFQFKALEIFIRFAFKQLENIFFAFFKYHSSMSVFPLHNEFLS